METEFQAVCFWYWYYFHSIFMCEIEYSSYKMQCFHNVTLGH